MKHQVFFFLLIFSLSTYAMNKNEQIITRINEYCSQVNYHFPDRFNQDDVEQVNKEITQLMRSSLSEQEKIEVVKQGIGSLPAMIMVGNRPVLIMVGNRPVLLDCNEKNEYTGHNRVY
jgi:hypothetical protein